MAFPGGNVAARMRFAPFVDQMRVTFCVYPGRPVQDLTGRDLAAMEFWAPDTSPLNFLVHHYYYRMVRLGSFPVLLLPIRTPFIELLSRIRVLRVASDVVFAVPLPRLSVDDSFSLLYSLGACSESRKPIVPLSLACPSRSPGTRCCNGINCASFVFDDPVKSVRCFVHTSFYR
jgi:hypothetical protein